MNLDLDLDVPRPEDNQGALPEAEAFPERAPEAPAQRGFLQSSSEAPQESSESAEAPARRRKAPKLLPWDDQRSLRNSDLASWNNNYAANMAAAKQVQQQRRATALAKKNAYAWVWGNGIGGVGLGLGAAKLPSPLSMFAGDQLMTYVTGIEPARGRKRSRAEEETGDSDSEGRRVRAKEDDGDQVGRGEQTKTGPGDEDTMGMGMGGDDVRPSQQQ